MNKFSKEQLQPISLAEARGILGDASEDMSDAEIENLVYNLTFLARSYVQESSIYEGIQ